MELEIKEKLERFLPIRVVLRIQENKIQGKIENSFSMDWSSKLCNIFWSGKAYSILGETTLNGPEWASNNYNHYKHNEFIIDPLAEDSPIEVDWEKWLNATEKFDKRNAPFKVKMNGEFILRALSAERELRELKVSNDSLSETLTRAQDKLNNIANIICQTNDDEQ